MAMNLEQASDLRRLMSGVAAILLLSDEKDKSCLYDDPETGKCYAVRVMIGPVQVLRLKGIQITGGQNG